MRRLAPGCLLLLVACPSVAVAGDISVMAGDPALLKVLRDAQRERAKAEAFPHGEMKVVVERGGIHEGRGEVPERRVEASVRWDGDDCRLDGSITDFGEKIPGGSRQRAEILYNKKRRILYLPDQNLMRVSQVMEGKYPSLTRLMPDEWWYGRIDGEQTGWEEGLDWLVKLPDDALRHYRISRLDEDRVELAREGGGTFKGHSRRVYSLGRDGNLIEAELFDAKSGFGERRHYAWEPTPGGGWYPKTIRITRIFPRGEFSAQTGSSFRYEVLAIDDGARPGRQTFADDAIRPKPGTYVEDEKTGKRFRLGDARSEAVIDTPDVSPAK